MKNNILPKNLFRNGFSTSKDTSSEPINIGSLEIICNFIRENFKKRKTINIKIGSRRLKHVAEEEIADNKFFISNGDLIASMILEGYEYKKDGKDTANANFNLSQLSVRRFRK